MILEISLRVDGLDRAKEGPDNALEDLGKNLEGLYGVVAARCNLESQRITVCYDPDSVTILRILNRIESAGRQQGLIYRAMDIHKGQERSSASGGSQISSGPIPAVDTAHLSAL